MTDHSIICGATTVFLAVAAGFMPARGIGGESVLLTSDEQIRLIGGTGGWCIKSVPLGTENCELSSHEAECTGQVGHYCTQCTKKNKWERCCNVQQSQFTCKESFIGGPTARRCGRKWRSYEQIPSQGSSSNCGSGLYACLVDSGDCGPEIPNVEGQGCGDTICPPVP